MSVYQSHQLLAPPSPGWWARRAAAWPHPAAAMPPATAGLALLAASAAAWLLVGVRPGVGVLLVGLLVWAATLPAGRRAWREPDNALLGGAAIALLGVAAWRDAGWVVGLCLLAAVPCAVIALTGLRTPAGVVTGWLALPWAFLRLPAWLQVTAVRRLVTLPVARGLGLTAGVLLLFLPLFASADVVFASLLSGLVPDLQLVLLPFRLVVFAFVAAVALVAALITAAPPRWDPLSRPWDRRLGRVEWAIPLMALNAVFVGFLAVQAAGILGGDAYVQRTAGLTYAEYARRGFGQLLVATALTGIVVAAGAATAPRRTAADRRLTRATLASLCLLCLLTCFSALARLGLYEEEFGFTRARTFARFVEIGVGFVLVLLLAAVLTNRWTWLPRAVVGSAAVALLVLAALNPDAAIARNNVERWEHTQRIDLEYLSGLSADAAPALDRLPEPLRAQALACISARLPAAEPWPAANRGRAVARGVFARAPVPDVGPGELARACRPYFG